MKNGKIIFSTIPDADENMQACAVYNSYQPERREELKLVFETRQLYAAEAEDYFFYFIGVQKNNTADRVA